MSRRNRVVLLLGAVVVVVGGFVLVSSGKSEKVSHPSGHAYIYVEGGKARGGVQTLSYNKGEEVVFTVVSDEAEEIHVHGFNLKKDVPKGGSVTFSFPASDQGGHVIELERLGQQIANLEVR
jgi:hypothetical protein